MSSWLRDIAKKTPNAVESMPVFESPSTTEPVGSLMRVFEAVPNEKKTNPIFIQPIISETPKTLLHNFDIPSRINKTNTSVKTQPIIQPIIQATDKKNLMLTFEQPTRLKKNILPQNDKSVPANIKIVPTVKPVIKQFERPESPQVTILIDVKDNNEFTEALLQSISRQTFNNWVGLIGLRNTDEQVKNRIRDSILKLQNKYSCKRMRLNYK